MIRWTHLALAATLAGLPVTAGAQKSAAADTAGINTTLRAFYFNLAHRDWEAIASQVLPAKVAAHRPPPEAMVAAAASTEGMAAVACDSTGALAGARISVIADWAEVSVPRCLSAAPGAADELRLIRFEERWRIVYIDVVERAGGGATALIGGPASR